jgi:azurin
VWDLLTLQVTTKGDALIFNKRKMTANAGQQLVLVFSNPSSNNQHNWVLVQDGAKDVVAEAGAQADSDAGWVRPCDERILANTRLLSPGMHKEIRFIAPAAGTYQFVYTFPGHNFTMFGDFIVVDG